MQGGHVGVGELLGIGELLLAVVNHQSADGEPQQQQAERRQATGALQIGLHRRSHHREYGRRCRPGGRHAHGHEPEGEAGGRAASEQLKQGGRGHGGVVVSEIMASIVKEREAPDALRSAQSQQAIRATDWGRRAHGGSVELSGCNDFVTRR